MADDDQTTEDDNKKSEIEETEDRPEETTETPEKETKEAESKTDGKKPSQLKALWAKYLAKKKLTIPLTILVALGLILAVPQTRYPALGLFLKKDFTVTVLDNSTGKPVTKAAINLAGQSVQTDNAGRAKLHVKVGYGTLVVDKKYYKASSQKVLVSLGGGTVEIKVEATGRQVPVIVHNKIGNMPLENAVVKASDTEAKTDKDGKVTIVLPADKTSVEATVTADGYNQTKVTIKVTEQEVADNTFLVTPAGKLYFLSKQSGKIDVVKTNLDGSERQTILAGTGKEDESGTVLLASRDWKYLALQAKREGDKAKLYLIDTSSDKLTTMDEGDAVFTITGWLDHNFIYTVNRNGLQAWQPKQAALKSYNAEKQSLTTLDETAGEGTGQYDNAHEYFGEVYALKGIVLFVKNWDANYYSPTRLDGKQAVIVSVKADGSGKTVVKAITRTAGAIGISFSSRAYEAGGVYFEANTDSSIYKYEDGSFSATTEVNAANFYDKIYPTFLQSPNGKENFWSESRDGKNTLFVGDEDGKNGKQIASLSEQTQFGWYTDNYLLTSQKGSELYILPRAGGTPLKVSDYHKPTFNYYGYGGGYGGI